MSSFILLQAQKISFLINVFIKKKDILYSQINNFEVSAIDLVNTDKIIIFLLLQIAISIVKNDTT